LAVDVEQVVSPAMTGLHDYLAHRDTGSSEEVEVLPVLNPPPRVGQLPVDQHARTLLRRQLGVAITGIHCSQP
jgi:hypothetical protein